MLLYLAMQGSKNIRYKKVSAGFTLVELIVYIALVTIFMTSAVLFAWDIIYGREKSTRQGEVQQNARAAMDRIGYEIDRAETLGSISSSQLILQGSGGLTTIELDGARLSISPNGVGPYYLTSNQVVVSTLEFSQQSTIDSDSESIGVRLVVEHAGVQLKGELTVSTELTSTFELKGDFNEGRRLLIDTSAATLVGGSSLQGLRVENISGADIILDKALVSWTGLSGSENVTVFQIGAGAIEWTGLASSGSVIELDDFVLVSAGEYVIDFIDFDSDMTGGTAFLELIAGDGSGAKALFALSSSGPVPSPSPSPPPSSCESVCIGLGYTSGICRGNNGQCNQNGETGESSGNQYCTGGPSADTCCCVQ